MDNPTQPGEEKRSKLENEEGTPSDMSRSTNDTATHSSDAAHTSSPTLDPIREQHPSDNAGYGGNQPQYESSDPKDTSFSKSTVRETTPDYQMNQQKSEGNGDIEEVHSGQGFARRRFGRYRKQIRIVIHAAIFILFTG